MAEQTAAEKAAAENAATGAKAQQEAAEKAATDATAKANAESKAKTGAPKPTSTKALKVVGAAVVLRAEDGSERYLYRGAPVDPAAWSKDSIKHATATGLIAKA